MKEEKYLINEAPLAMQLENIDTKDVMMLECYPDKIFLEGEEATDAQVVWFLKSMAAYYKKQMDLFTTTFDGVQTLVID